MRVEDWELKVEGLRFRVFMKDHDEPRPKA